MRREYYSPSNAASVNLSGWEVASSSAYANLKEQLSAHSTLPGRLLLYGGATGFNAFLLGWYDYSQGWYGDNLGYTEFVTKEGGHVSISNSGSIEVSDPIEGGPYWQMGIRLIKQ